MIYAGMRIGVGEDRLFVFVAEAVDRLDLYVRSGIRQRVIEHVIRGLVVAAAVVQDADVIWPPSMRPCPNIGSWCRFSRRFHRH